MPLVPQPGAAQDENVQVAVVVVVGVDQVEPAGQPDQARLLRALGEGPVPVVVEEPELAPQVPGGDHEVEEPVAVQVLQDDPARQAAQVEADLGRNVGEAADVRLRREMRRADQPRGRHPVGVFPERHVGDVEQPDDIGAGVGIKDRLHLAYRRP